LYVSGGSVRVDCLVALLAALEKTRPDLAAFIRTSASNDDVGVSELVELYCDAIRCDYAACEEAAECRAISRLEVQRSASTYPKPAAANAPSEPELNIIDMTEDLSMDVVQDVVFATSRDALPFPPPPPPLSMTKSQRDAIEVARRLDEQDKRRRELFYCVVCLEDHPIHGCYTLECGHRCCEDSLKGYVMSKIHGNEVSDDKLICPHDGCKVPISITTIRGLTKDSGDVDAYEKFDAFRTEAYLNARILASAMMRCPSGDCNYAFEWRPDGGSLYFQCLKCYKDFCLNCKVVGGGVGPGHYPYSCQEQVENLERSVAEKKKFEEWKALNARAQELFDEAITKNGWRSKSYKLINFVILLYNYDHLSVCVLCVFSECPHCTSAIERNTGCDHMTCRTCGCQFCYICGKYNPERPTTRGDCGTSCQNRSRR
jgi:hypothetical protein